MHKTSKVPRVFTAHLNSSYCQTFRSHSRRWGTWPGTADPCRRVS